MRALHLIRVDENPFAKSCVLIVWLANCKKNVCRPWSVFFHIRTVIPEVVVLTWENFAFLADPQLNFTKNEKLNYIILNFR